MTAVLRDAYRLTVSSGSRVAMDAHDRATRSRPTSPAGLSDGARRHSEMLRDVAAA